MSSPQRPDRSCSIYVVLGAAIIASVVLILSFSSAYSYQEEKKRIIEEIHLNSSRLVSSLQETLSGLIASYAVNEYQTLVATELLHHESFAIIIDDFNLGEIAGEGKFTTGKMFNNSGQVIDYDPHSSLHNTQINNSFYADAGDIHSEAGERIGRVAVYISDKRLNEELTKTIRSTVVNTLAISILLFITLFLSIRLFVLQPIDRIISGISRSDADGIPMKPIANSGPAEVRALSNTINNMLESVRSSRAELKEQHQYLQKIINGVDDPIMVIKSDYSVDLMNNAVRKAYDPAFIADPTCPKCYEVSHHRNSPCDGNEHPCPLKQVMDTGNQTVMIHRHELHGEKRFVELSATPLRDESGKPVGIIEAARDITSHLEVQDELREQKDALTHIAHHDTLTGLANRVLFNDRMEQAIEKAKRYETQLAVMFIDLDHFKEINDSLGHKVGDHVLISVADRLAATIRKEDSLARLGGDEFTVMIQGLVHGEDAIILAEKIHDALLEPIHVEGKELYISCSIGISLFPDNGVSAVDLLRCSDAAMYKAKNEGRNNFQFYSEEMTRQALERVSMESELRVALAQDQFVVFYQPQIDIESHRITGMEALVRWEHPELGMVPPGRFIPIAEATGLIVELDRLVMNKSVQRLVEWQRAGVDTGTLAMNLSIIQLQNSGFLAFLKELIRNTGCEPEWLELEITESQVMTKPEENIRTLNEITELGIKLALDDFGTGYSSLAYLKRLPISKLKIDRSFIKDLPDDEDDVAISSAVIALAQSLQLDILAEGVETPEQNEFLAGLGCKKVQGYLYSEPVDAVRMEEMLNRGRCASAMGSSAVEDPMVL